MKYLAICFLSLAASFTARTAPSANAGVKAAIFSPSLTVSAASRLDNSTSDRALSGVLAAALVALQLRRRQKSLRMPRSLN